MRFRYSKYTGEDLEGLDLDELVSRLSDFFLGSGFDDPYGDSAERTLQELYDAILHAIMTGDLLPPETLERLLNETGDDGRAAIESLVERIAQQLAERGYVTTRPPEGQLTPGTGMGDRGDARKIRFEITDKSIDFLGYRALRDLLGSVGRSAMGRHDTRELDTGIEASGAAKPYEFGDTLNLDASATLLNAAHRHAEAAAQQPPGGPLTGLDVSYEDLMVAQGEYHSSCATVLLLDCSHSMILYGEDRFTPAKQVALALTNLIRRQYPGDALHVVLFHDSAEEIPVSQLARVHVGPHYTNTREGLRLARRVLERQRKDMRQIIMITDGKPSALTRPDGRIYRNAFGLDPLIVAETFAEVAACRKAGIQVNTFMLARDYDLVAFVRKVTQICHGKAYFTTPMTLGRYVLMDYVTKKSRLVH